MGTAPLYVLESRSETETTRFGFIVPQLNVPISIPVSLRTASDYGVRLTVSEVTQQIPLAGYNMTIWGFPAKGEHDESRFAIGEPGKPSNCPSLVRYRHAPAPTSAPIPVKPLTSNPSVCTGKPLTVTLDVSTYQDPGHLAHAEDTYPETTDCEQQTFRPVFNVDVTNHSSDSPAGLEIQLKAPQPLAFSASPAQIRSATLLLPEGLNINPDAADGQGILHRRRGQLRLRGPGGMSGPGEDRQLRHRIAGARRAPERLALLRRTEARRPVPGLHDRLRLRNQRETRRVRASRSPQPAASPCRSRTFLRCHSKASISMPSPPTGP